MILISKTITGILIQKDDQDIEIDQPAVLSTLGPILLALIDAGRMLAHVRREAYESGLAQGRINALIEEETRARIAQLRAADTAAWIAGAVCADAA